MMSADASSGQSSLQDKMKRLRQLQSRRAETQRLNHREVVEENRRNSQPKQHQVRQQWAELKLHEIKEREAAENEGVDYDRQKMLDVTAEQAAKWQRIEKKKRNPDPGFSNYEAASIRKYERLVKNIKPDMERYSACKEQMGEAFYAGAGTVVQGLHKDSQSAIDRMADDLEKQSVFSAAYVLSLT